jgi:hypothetical protein
MAPVRVSSLLFRRVVAISPGASGVALLRSLAVAPGAHVCFPGLGFLDSGPPPVIGMPIERLLGRINLIFENLPAVSDKSTEKRGREW